MDERQQALQRSFLSTGSDAQSNTDLLWSGDLLASEMELLHLIGPTGTPQTAANDSPSLVDSGSLFENGQNVGSQSQLLLDALISARQSAPAAPLRHDSREYFDVASSRGVRGWTPQPQPQIPPRPAPYEYPAQQAQWQLQPTVEMPPMLAAGFLSQGGRPSTSYASQQQVNHPGPFTQPVHGRSPRSPYNSYSGTNQVAPQVPHQVVGNFPPNQGHHHRGGGAGAGGGGYRKLWAQVNKVSKGGKLDDGDISRPLTVEDLIHIVLMMPPGEPAVPAIAPGLVYLDSSAFAAMLKELNKQGHQHRCNEIFDWLRGLPASHDLYRLCDVFTYTTMISQCGSQQYLRRGLELVAEMKSRGITLNVHTYSALMNVCVKANELDLARDIFTQMRDEGCQPNLVTYNILIDVHVKKGNWREAVSVLDSLEQENILIEARTYNTILSACNKCGLPEEALKVYRRMIASGVAPTATTFTGLITAYGKTGRIDQAMEVYRDMSMRGCERNVITYSSLISAAEKAGRLDIALELLKTMQKEGIRPNTITYNSLLAACCHGGNWEMAQHLFDQMQKEGNRPDGITFAALINAFEKGHQWRLALAAMDLMQSIGLHPDANIFNSLLDVLWQSGIALAQARALQLWSLANRTGLFRIYINNKAPSDASSQLQYTALALSGGAMCVTVLRWIGDMKSRVTREGVAFLRGSVSLLLYRSKSSSGPYMRSTSSVQEGGSLETESSYGHVSPSTADPFSLATLETISSMLAGAASPLTVNLASAPHLGDTESNNIGSLENPFLRLEAPASTLGPWLSSNECSNLLLLAAQGGSIQLRKSHETALNDDMALAMRSREAFETALRLELSQSINLQAYNPLVISQRIHVVGTAIKICGSLSFGQDAVYDSLLRFDRCLSTLGSSFDPLSWPLLLSACILHSGLQADALTRMILAITGGREDQVRMNLSPQSRDIASGIIQQPVEAIAQMERTVVDILGQESLGNFSTLKFTELLLQRLGLDANSVGGEEGTSNTSSFASRITSDIHVLLTKASCSTAMMPFRPSLVASASLLLARKKHGSVPFWPGALQLMTGCTLTDPKLNKESELSACVACLSSLGDN